MEEAQPLADRVVVIAAAASSPRARPTRSPPPTGEAVVSFAPGGAPSASAPPPRPPTCCRCCAPRPARRGARGADRHAALARGRLPPADRGARMTASPLGPISDAPCSGAGSPPASGSRCARRARSFTFAFPLVLMTLFSGLDGDEGLRGAAARCRSRSSTRRRSASSASRPPATRPDLRPRDGARHRACSSASAGPRCRWRLPRAWPPARADRPPRGRCCSSSPSPSSASTSTSRRCRRPW